MSVLKENTQRREYSAHAYTELRIFSSISDDENVSIILYIILHKEAFTAVNRQIYSSVMWYSKSFSLWEFFICFCSINNCELGYVFAIKGFLHIAISC